MPYFYHYTDDEGALNIIRTGRILASLTFMAGDDAAYGNGVYLTKLNPETSSKDEIARNNWRSAGANFIKKTENYFVLDIPDSVIKDANATDRNIFVFGRKNDLLLYKYPWWLKNFESGQIIASYKYHLTSFGPLSTMKTTLKNWPKLAGDYIMQEDTVNGRPVYKHRTSKAFIHMSSDGKFWYVGDDSGEDCGWLNQRIITNQSLGPDSNLPWKYYTRNGWKRDDSTLKTHAWQA